MKILEPKERSKNGEMSDDTSFEVPVARCEVLLRASNTKYPLA